MTDRQDGMRFASTTLCAPYITSMIITGLEAYGSHDKAADAAIRYQEAKRTRVSGLDN